MSAIDELSSDAKPRITLNRYATEPRFRWRCAGRASRDYGATPYQAWVHWTQAVGKRLDYFRKVPE